MFAGQTGRSVRLVAAALGLAAALLAAEGVLPASAHAADLFPVDDWLSSGLKKAGELVLGPLVLRAAEIARLLAMIVGALADLLVPKSLVKEGVDGVRWLVQLPPVGAEVSASGAVGATRMPHLAELRATLTWIGLTLLPLGVVVTAGRAFLSPGADSESPAEVLQRALVAGFGLLVYDWAWGVVSRLSRLLTDALLGLPWVADGVERMFEALLIGGASGTAAAAEFVVPLLVLAAGGALLALLLLRVGLEVVTALVYALGGLVLATSVTSLGRRLLAAWLVAASAVALLPVLWSIVFVTGAALMLDADSAPGDGFAGFVAQLYNVAASLAAFAVSIKLAQGVMRLAGGAITNVAMVPTAGAGGAGAGGGSRALADGGRALAARATPAGLARFSQQLRAGVGGGLRTASAPLRHPALTAHVAGSAARGSVQATRAGADALRGALSGPAGAALVETARARGARHLAGPHASATSVATESTGNGVPSGTTARSDGSVVGGRRARAAAAREQRARTQRSARTDWATPRSIAASRAARASGPAAPRRVVRVAGTRPWWLGRPTRTRRSDTSKRDDRGGRRG